jgi:uncharacterized membrane protein YfcA
LPTLTQPHELLLLFIAGFLASALNAVAGGGTLISFPMLIGLGINPIVANATNGVALFPGSLSGALGFKEYWGDIKQELIRLGIPTVIGSALGAVLLKNTSKQAFDIAIPILILIAILLMAFKKQLRPKRSEGKAPVGKVAAMAFQFLIAVYGGYFGAGMGILMLALLTVSSSGEIHRHNAIKNLLGVIIKLTSSVILLISGLVLILPAVVMTAGSICGGYASARMSLKVDPEKLRWAIVSYGAIMVCIFFWRAFGAS